MIRVSVVGAKGRMGSHVVEAVRAADDTELALALDAGDDLTQITPQNTDVVVEFTVPAVSLNNVLTLVRQGVNVVVGTTGWTGEKLGQRCAPHSRRPRRSTVASRACSLRRISRSPPCLQMCSHASPPLFRIRRGDRTASPRQGRCTVRHRHPHRPRDCRRPQGGRSG